MTKVNSSLFDDVRVAEIRQLVTRWISEPEARREGHATCVSTIPASPDDVLWLCNLVEKLAKAVRTADDSYSEAINQLGYGLIAAQERALAAEDLRPGVVWVNIHTGETTRLTAFASRVERVPDPRGGFRDDPQLVVHHTANVPPGFKWGHGDDLCSFTEHWESERLFKQTVTKSADSPITEERPRDVGAPGAAT